MARNRPLRERNRGRELLTLLLAVTLTVLLGRALLGVVPSQPALLVAVVYLLLYAGSFALCWQLTGRFMRR